MAEPVIRTAAFAELSAAQLYALLRLRVDVFIVEQDCPYPELDGRDTEPQTRHWWVEIDGEPAATLRSLGADPVQIGRVATAAEHRGRGYAAMLMAAALESVGSQQVRIAAQSYLEGWYAGFGFERCGEDFLEDGIRHLPMLRPASTPG